MAIAKAGDVQGWQGQILFSSHTDTDVSIIKENETPLGQLAFSTLASATAPQRRSSDLSLRTNKWPRNFEVDFSQVPAFRQALNKHHLLYWSNNPSLQWQERNKR